MMLIYLWYALVFPCLANALQIEFKERCFFKVSIIVGGKGIKHQPTTSECQYSSEWRIRWLHHRCLQAWAYQGNAQVGDASRISDLGFTIVGNSLSKHLEDHLLAMPGHTSFSTGATGLHAMDLLKIVHVRTQGTRSCFINKTSPSSP